MHFFSDVLGFTLFCIIAIFLKIVFTALYNIYLHPLRHYPGPKSWAATRLSWTIALQRGHLHKKLLELHERYGPIVRIAPDELAYNNAQAWKDIYGNRTIEKNRIWAGQEEAKRPMSVVSSDETTHLRNRRALTGAFTDHAVAEQHGPVVEGLVDLMISKFRDAVSASANLDSGHQTGIITSEHSGQTTAVVNLVDWFDFLIFDISGALSFGTSFSSVENGVAHPWVEISRSFGKGIALRASINFFRPLDRLMKYAMPKHILAKMQYHKDLVHERLGQRLAMDREVEGKEGSRSKRQDFVSSIQAYNASKNTILIPRDEMEANMTVLIFAGSETTSTALAGIFNQLLRHPPVLSKLQSEILGAFTTEQEITIASTAKLPYLSAVINEGLRMTPPPSIGVPRVTPKQGATICDKFVPPGTYVAVNQFATFRSSANFSRPHSFVPERFLGPEMTPFPDDELASFEPWLVGRHKCLGMRLALAEMHVVIARILFAFEVEVEVAGKAEVKDFAGQKTFIFWEKEALDVRLRERE